MSFGTGSFGVAPFGAPGIEITEIVESLTAYDTHTVELIDMLRQILYARDILTADHQTNVIESLNTYTILEASTVYGIVERIAANDSVVAQLSTFQHISEALTARDVMAYILELAVVEASQAVGTFTAEASIPLSITDTAVLFDIAHIAPSYFIGISETAIAAAAIAVVKLLDITDVALAQATLETTVQYFANILDEVTAQDTVLAAARLTVIVSDEAETTDTIASATTFFATIEESVFAVMTLTIEGQPYTATVINALNKAVTEYSPYDFNSLAFFNGQTYGVNAVGLCKLSGSDDAGVDIDARLRTALSRIAGGKQANVESAYLGYSSNGTVQLKTITTEPNGSKLSRVYQLNMQTATTMRAGRIKLGRGIKSAYWAFEISNVLGADFTIDVIELHVLALSRRI